MNISYVTGYMERNLEESSSSILEKHAADESSPKPAPECVNWRGPKFGKFSDPIAAVMKGKVCWTTCYSDNIGAWTLNEITINWNAASMGYFCFR
ncbi:glycoside hydrolase family 9 protein [Vibrio lentus]|nr:glycoside hydrolase family 9 protein [Vibrio lentus]